MNPDVADAIPKMVHDGILDENTAFRLLRIARGEILSVNPELRLLFYFGVLLTTAGVGVLVKDNYQHIGPLAVAIIVGLGALASFGWAVRQAPQFSWNETPSPSLGFDYSLLLGVLLASADLAFIEVQFTPLGDHWPWHLLIISCLMAVIAVRYDSRSIFSLALSTFAAWRGVSVSLIKNPLWYSSGEMVRWNALACGSAFIFLGWFLVRARRKAHFEPAAVYLGWLLIFGALLSGTLEYWDGAGVYRGLLIITGIGLSLYSFRKRRFGLFVFGFLGGFIALIEWVSRLGIGSLGSLFLLACLSIGLLIVLWQVHGKLKENS